MSIPYTIETIREQLGRGLRGAPVYVGTRSMSYSHPDRDRDGECHPHRPSSVDIRGMIDVEVGLTLKVNGTPDRDWTIIVSYEADDTYTVYLWQACIGSDAEAGKFGEVIAKREMVFCMDLQRVVEEMYNDAIRTHNGGFIPLGKAC